MGMLSDARATAFAFCLVILYAARCIIIAAMEEKEMGSHRAGNFWTELYGIVSGALKAHRERRAASKAAAGALPGPCMGMAGSGDGGGPTARHGPCPQASHAGGAQAGDGGRAAAGGAMEGWQELAGGQA